MIGNDRILLYEWADFSVIVYRDFQEREVQHMLTTIKPKKKTLILYLLVPVLMFVFTVFVPLVTALSGKAALRKHLTDLLTTSNWFMILHSGSLLDITFIW